jgi:hypothetical protein
VLALHLRPGARQWFMAWLAREHPELVPRYEQLYRRGAYVPAEYRSWLAARVAQILRRHGLDRQSGGAARGAAGAEPVRGLPGDSEGEFPPGSLPTGGMPGVAPAPEGAKPAEQPSAAEEPEQLSLL